MTTKRMLHVAYSHSNGSNAFGFGRVALPLPMETPLIFSVAHLRQITNIIRKREYPDQVVVLSWQWLADEEEE